VDQSTSTFFRPTGCRFSKALQIFDMLISSGDIRDKSRKLSKIAPNFGHFLDVTNFWGQAL